MTVSAIALFLGFVLFRAKGVRLEPGERRAFLCGATWLVGGYGITVFLPVRFQPVRRRPLDRRMSRRRDCVNALWRSATCRTGHRALIAGIVLPVCLIPVYKARTQEFVRLSDLSTQVVRDIIDETRNLPADSAVVIVDDPATRMNVSAIFGTLLNEAVLLEDGTTSRQRHSPAATTRTRPDPNPPCETCVRLRLRLVGGRLVGSPSTITSPPKQSAPLYRYLSLRRPSLRQQPLHRCRIGQGLLSAVVVIGPRIFRVADG